MIAIRSNNLLLVFVFITLSVASYRRDLLQGVPCKNASPVGDPNQCGSYFTCKSVNGVWNIYQLKCLFNQAFNQSKRKCGPAKCPSEESPEGRGLALISALSARCSSNRPSADPNQCGWYYQCVRIGFLWTTQRRKCPSGLMFSNILGQCGPYRCYN